MIIDISTEEKRNEITDLFKSFNTKSDIFKHFNVPYNTQNGKYVNNILEKLGFDKDFYHNKRFPKRYCLTCGKLLKKGQYKFCSHSCSAKTNNKTENRKMSVQTKIKISNSLKNYYTENPKKKPIYTCEKCGKQFEHKTIKPTRHVYCDDCKRDNNTLLSCSKRTVSKILKRSKIGCSLCGWNESSCDLHHIIPRHNGGSNECENLIVVCPNCHRVIHTTNKYSIDFLKKYNLNVTLPNWKDFYYPQE